MKRLILNPIARLRPELTRGVVACALIALPVTPTATIVGAQPAVVSASGSRAELRYTVRFEGVGAEGVDDVWRGPLAGATPGEVTLRVEYRGAPADVARPVWPVRVMAFVAADDPTKSFLAETDGTLDWRTGAMQLTGRVSEGWMNGASVQQTLTLDRKRLGGEGVIRLGVVTASR
jgi:hypothetical protein